MGIKKFKPRTPSQRYRTVSDFGEITTDKPEKSPKAGKSSAKSGKGKSAA